MKMTRVFGVVLTLAATMAVSGAMGQTFKNLPAPTAAGDGNYKNYVELKSTGMLKGETSTGTMEDYSLVQVGKSFLIAVLPDAAAHPSYDTDRKLTAGYRWIWNSKDSTATAYGTAVTKTAGATQPDDANTNTFNFSDTTTYNITVEAQYPTSFGTSCSGNIRYVNVVVLPKPYFNSAQTTQAGITNSICVSAKPTATATFKLKAIGTPQIQYRIQKEVYNLSTGTWNTASTLATTTTTFAEQWLHDQVAATSAKKDSCVVDLKTPFSIGTADHKPTLASYDLTIERTFSMPTASEKVVRYTILLDGINSSISRKADYPLKGDVAPATVPTFTFYQKDGTAIASASGPVDTKSAVYSFVYAIAPTTGPVFHLSNAVAK